MSNVNFVDTERSAAREHARQVAYFHPNARCTVGGCMVSIYLRRLASRMHGGYIFSNSPYLYMHTTYCMFLRSVVTNKLKISVYSPPVLYIHPRTSQDTMQVCVPTQFVTVRRPRDFKIIHTVLCHWGVPIYMAQWR